MKPLLRSLFHGLVGLLTWVVLTDMFELSYYHARFLTKNIFFLLLAAALCWITSFRNTHRWERWVYTGILVGTFYRWDVCLFYAICFTCVTVSSFRSESRCNNLFKNQSRLTTRIVTILYWIWVAILGGLTAAIIADYIQRIS